ncbi:peptidoglycan DD-metalloendopeptidase family protein [candidate division KSB3 bacterium]|uniref:Peptidoglycan DD-metalloendopeptidase family protein n=1 Tax=candidate division KSB3 bacterium TaxID=2044937 RepID=A0A9D5Q5P2_9BACT|nr:peptidoglycan DD-metalloendopeptidase family protein [candidate division KSB3 bacterium]MBD3325034.1 peptidoglycan DD-metalloendopeptidase family protein [candidate division KSB3 bacterium]
MQRMFAAMAPIITRWTASLKSGKRWLLLMACLLVGLSASEAQEAPSDPKRTDLQSLQQQLKEKQANYKQLERQEQTLVTELQAIDQRLKASHQRLQQQKTALAQNAREREEIQQRLTRLKKQYATKQATLAKRLRAIYKMGKFGYLSPLLAISAQANTQQQLKYLQQISESDLTLINTTEQDMQAIRNEQKALKARQQEIEHLQHEIEQQSKTIAAQRHEKTQLLQRLRQDKQQFARMIHQLEASATELEDFLASLEAKQQKQQQEAKQARENPSAPQVTFPTNEQEIVKSYGQDFRANKGKLLWPVQGKIITNFGKILYPETNTYTFYKGVDIQAESGTPFYAVFKGVVKYADWFEGYGNLIILDHGGSFYTLYAHADEIAVKAGELVDTRQPLGKVGETESLKGPHLYFEVRAKGKPDNPQRWLAKLER